MLPSLIADALKVGLFNLVGAVSLGLFSTNLILADFHSTDSDKYSLNYPFIELQFSSTAPLGFLNCLSEETATETTENVSLIAYQNC